MSKPNITPTIVPVPISILCQAKITATQFTFLYLLNNKDWGALRDYVSHNKGFPRHEVKDLYDRGYILYFPVNKQIETSHENLYVTEKFTDLINKDNIKTIESLDAFNELNAAYPAYIYIDGRPTAARNIDVELGQEQYSRIIKGIREEHQKIIDDIIYAKKLGILNMGLKKFLDTHQWLSIRELREQGNTES